MPDVWTVGQVTQGFGPTAEQLDGPYLGYEHFNKGIDLAAPEGTVITSLTPGEVVRVNTDAASSDGWGVSVWVKDKQGNIHRYNHMKATFPLKVGDKVKQGSILGLVGSTGRSTGSHLSYDVTNSKGEFFDSMPFISGKTSASLPNAPKWTEAPLGQGSGLLDIKAIPKLSSPVAHLLPPNIANADFETQIDYLMDSYFDLLDQVTSQGLDSLSDDDILLLDDAQKQVLGRFNAVGKALNTLMSMKNQGLVTTGLDAAKAFVETEEGKQQNAGRAFDDYTKRVSTLTGLETFRNNVYKQATDKYFAAEDFNAQLEPAIYKGEVSQNTLPRMVALPQSRPDIDTLISRMGASIPNQVPSGYNINPSAYDNFYNEVNNRAGRRGLSSLYKPQPTSQYTDEQQQALFGIGAL